MVQVFTTPNCVQCTMTKRHLDKRGVAYTEVPIDQILGAAQAAGITSAPVVVSGEQMWGGYRPDRVDALVMADA